MADTENVLQVENRTVFGKGAARKIRATNKVPAVLYGHGTDPLHLTLPGHATMLLIRQSNALVNLEVAGGSSHLALVKDVQRDPVTRIIEHIDFVVIRKGERVEVEIPVHLEGESFSGTVAFQDATHLYVSAPATSIPDEVIVSIEGLEEGAVIHATDVKLPSGVSLVDDETELIVVSVQVPRVDTSSDASPEVDEEETESAAADSE